MPSRPLFRRTNAIVKEKQAFSEVFFPAQFETLTLSTQLLQLYLKARKAHILPHLAGGQFDSPVLFLLSSILSAPIILHNMTRKNRTRSAQYGAVRSATSKYSTCKVGLAQRQNMFPAFKYACTYTLLLRQILQELFSNQLLIDKNLPIFKPSPKLFKTIFKFTTCCKKITYHTKRQLSSHHSKAPGLGWACILVTKFLS